MNRALFPGVPVSKQSAMDFLRGKGIYGSVIYSSTVFDVGAYTDIADIFTCGEYLVKTSIETVLEFYMVDHSLAVDSLGVSLDLITSAPLEMYYMRNGCIEKPRPDGGTTITSPTDFAGLPPDVQLLLAEFPFKDTIKWYSDKPNGRFIEYKRSW